MAESWLGNKVRSRMNVEEEEWRRAAFQSKNWHDWEIDEIQRM